MKYLSVCSGIEAATCAWGVLGWESIGFSEIESFPSALLAYRFPGIKNYGDMTTYEEWRDVGQFDVLVGGTPCQSFSVAGLRKGLDDPRGNLMLTFGAIADHFKPTWIVWENVPGVLSSNRGRDFGSFLGMLGQLGYGFVYRILDAQFYGVAQRRRRVFVVGYLGDWRRSAQVLFESESLCGYPAPSREKREGIATGVEIGPSVGSFTDVNPTLDTRCKDGPIRNQLAGAVLVGTQFGEEIAGTLTKRHDSSPCADRGQSVVYDMRGNGNGDIVPTITGAGRPTDYTPICFSQNTRDEVREMAIAGALSAERGAKQQSYFRQGLSVRRLTPRECERLQGFPDDWTRIPWRGASADRCPDGPRYKAVGNAMAVPVMRWIGERIQKEALENDRP